MKKTITPWIVATILAAIVCLFIVCVLCKIYPPDTPPNFRQMSLQVFGGVIATLFAVALFVERAVEVVIMVFRDEQAKLLGTENSRAAKASDAAIKVSEALASNCSADKTAKDLAAEAVTKARTALEDVQNRELHYRADTKRIATLVGFMLGALVSLAGVHSLGSLLVLDTTGKPQDLGALFYLADLIVTSAILAGGSEGIHHMTEAFTSVMDNLSARADQGQNTFGASAALKPS